MKAKLSREVRVYVRDTDGVLVPGVTIGFRVNGEDRGRIDYSDGHGTLTLHDPNGIIEVTVEYEGRTESRRLASDEQECTFVFPDVRVRANNPWLSGSFYLVAIVVIVGVAVVAAQYVNALTLPIVLIFGVLAFAVVGAFQLRQDQRLKEENFLTLMLKTLNLLPLLKQDKKPRARPKTN